MWADKTETMLSTAKMSEKQTYWKLSDSLGLVLVLVADIQNQIAVDIENAKKPAFASFQYWSMNSFTL